MAVVEIPVSIGELVDKITILRLKQNHIKDPGKQVNVAQELASLESRCEVHNIDLNDPLVASLQGINEKLWEIEDSIRDCERQKQFDGQFVELARAVYLTNDERFAVKSEINNRFGSSFREEKSYRPY